MHPYCCAMHHHLRLFLVEAFSGEESFQMIAAGTSAWNESHPNARTDRVSFLPGYKLETVLEEKAASRKFGLTSDWCSAFHQSKSQAARKHAAERTRTKESVTKVVWETSDGCGAKKLRREWKEQGETIIVDWPKLCFWRSTTANVSRFSAAFWQWQQNKTQWSKFTTDMKRWTFLPRLTQTSPVEIFCFYFDSVFLQESKQPKRRRHAEVGLLSNRFVSASESFSIFLSHKKEYKTAQHFLHLTTSNALGQNTLLSNLNEIRCSVGMHLGSFAFSRHSRSRICKRIHEASIQPQPAGNGMWKGNDILVFTFASGEDMYTQQQTKNRISNFSLGLQMTDSDRTVRHRFQNGTLTRHCASSICETKRDLIFSIELIFVFSHSHTVDLGVVEVQTAPIKDVGGYLPLSRDTPGSKTISMGWRWCHGIMAHLENQLFSRCFREIDLTLGDFGPFQLFPSPLPAWGNEASRQYPSWRKAGDSTGKRGKTESSSLVACDKWRKNWEREREKRRKGTKSWHFGFWSPQSWEKLASY